MRIRALASLLTEKRSHSLQAGLLTDGSPYSSSLPAGPRALALPAVTSLSFVPEHSGGTVMDSHHLPFSAYSFSATCGCIQLCSQSIGLVPRCQRRTEMMNLESTPVIGGKPISDGGGDGSIMWMVNAATSTLSGASRGICILNYPTEKSLNWKSCFIFSQMMTDLNLF